MGQTVFVKVVGFTDEERQALGLMFRMSEEQSTSFFAWTPGVAEPAALMLLDGSAAESRGIAESSRGANVPVIWVDDEPLADAARWFRRPIAWPELIQAMDELFPLDPTDSSFDLDLGGDEAETRPPDTQPSIEARHRALIASPSLDERLYLRAKLSLAGLTQADDAETAAQALELVRDNDYAVAIVDLGLGGMRGFELLFELRSGKRSIPMVIVTASRPTLVERMRARRMGIAALFDKPPHPEKLHALLVQA